MAERYLCIFLFFYSLTVICSKTVTVNLGSDVGISFKTNTERIQLCNGRHNQLNSAEIPKSEPKMPPATERTIMDGETEVTLKLTPVRYQPISDIVGELPDAIREIVSKIL